MQDLVLGRTTMLRDRIGRALQAWSANDPAWGYLLGMHAFGLEECGEYARAEALGQQAVALNADDAWAVHAVAHVYEMQGRVARGAALADGGRRWSVDNALAVHNQWHRALMHLSAGDTASVLALYDRAIAPGEASMAMDLVDASALLWRLICAASTPATGGSTGRALGRRQPGARSPSTICTRCCRSSVRARRAAANGADAIAAASRVRGRFRSGAIWPHPARP